MDSETNPAKVLFTESKRLGAFVDFWRRRYGPYSWHKPSLTTGIELKSRKHSKYHIRSLYASIIVPGSLDNLSGLQIPGQPVNGQLLELARKTGELLMDGTSNSLKYFCILNILVEIEERRRGLEKLQAAYKALSNEFWTEEGTDYFGQWGSRVETSLQRTDSLAAEVTTAKASAERLAVEEVSS